MKSNIQAAKAVSRVLRTSLGPKGMDKLLQGPDGDIVISERASEDPAHLCRPTGRRCRLLLRLPLRPGSLLYTSSACILHACCSPAWDS